MVKFDRYTIFARLFPAIIAIAPAIALAAMLIPWDRISLTHAIAAIALAVLLMVFADVARIRGLAVQPGIYQKTGGIPSTVMLRHRDDTFDPPTKARMHAFLATKLGEPAPTPDQETADPEAADSFYARAATWLRENTRNHKDFDLLFSENITYGFRRNTYGLRIPALALNGIIVMGCLAAYYFRLTQKYSLDLSPVFIIAFLHACYLAFICNESRVVDASRIYARQLLLSVESPKLAIKPPAATKTAAKSKSK